MNQITVLKKIDFEPDPDALFTRLRLKKGSRDASDFEEILKDAVAVARPKGIYRLAFIQDRGDDFIVLDGVRLTSRVMAVNLDDRHRAFPMIATCGREIEAWSKEIHDILHRFWVDSIMEVALRKAASAVMDHIKGTFDIENTSYMSPGSIDSWPLGQQPRLFELLGDAVKEIGVDLTESFLMIPTKTVSRLVFASEERYENCLLCPREGCPSRRAAFDPDLYARKYSKT